MGNVYWARINVCLQALKWFVACLKVQFYVLHFLMLPFKNIISKSAHFLLLFPSFGVLRLLPADPVPTLSALLPGLHASHLGGWPTSWFACGGERHHGGFRECQPRHVRNYRQVRVIIPACVHLNRIIHEWKCTLSHLQSTKQCYCHKSNGLKRRKNSKCIMNFLNLFIWRHLSRFFGFYVFKYGKKNHVFMWLFCACHPGILYKWIKWMLWIHSKRWCVGSFILKREKSGINPWKKTELS